MASFTLINVDSDVDSTWRLWRALVVSLICHTLSSPVDAASTHSLIVLQGIASCTHSDDETNTLATRGSATSGHETVLPVPLLLAAFAVPARVPSPRPTSSVILTNASRHDVRVRSPQCGPAGQLTSQSARLRRVWRTRK
ncbi:hypothetical protein BJY59DRAFT_695232 [Rhodotorula toruloides]